MKRSGVTWLALPATVLGVSGVARSQAIEEVKVVSQRLEESLPQQLEVSGARVTTVTAADIRNGGFNDLGQTLQYSVPGLYLAPTSGQFSYADVSLQGSRSADILWLVDGVRINNRLYSSTLPLDTIPAHMIERIEVLEGGQGLFYGSQAMAGVVNVITKDFTERSNGEVELGVDENDGRHASAYVRGSLGDNYLVGFASVDDGDGYQPFRNSDYQPSATDRKRGYDVKTGGLKFMRDFSDAVRFSATYQHTDADLELLTPMKVKSNVNSRDEDMLSAKLDVQVSDRVDLYVKGYYHDWDTRYTTLYNSLTTPGATDVVYDNAFWGFHDYGANALLRLNLNEGLEYFLGYELQKYGGKDDVLLIADNNEQTQAFIGQVRSTDDFSKKLHLSAGLRYNSPSDAESRTVWTATAKYDITPDLFLRTVVGTGFRLPTAEELYAIDPFEIGNPNLVPEKSKNLNVSIGGVAPFADGRVTWEAIGFARDITDLIGFEYDPVQDLDVAQNVPGKVKTRGGQFVLTAALSSAVRARLSYTRNSTENEAGKQLQRIPESLIQAWLDYDPETLPFGASVAVGRTGNVYATNFSGDVPYGNQAIVDLNARYYLDASRHHRLGVRLENAFDKEYGRPGTGRTDAGNSGYTIVSLATPRTAHLTYAYAF